MALLAAEEIVVLETEVVNPEALLDVAVVLEERGVVELELLALLLLEEGVVLELLLDAREVVELELVAVEEAAVLEVESVDVDAALDNVTVLEEREVTELELLVIEEEGVLEVVPVDVEEASGVEDVFDEMVV